MQQLDNNKIPKIRSDGEKYRDMQLIVQLPKQDLSDQHCRHLKGQAQKQGFDDFCKMRDVEAIDIGFIKDSVKENMVVNLIIDIFVVPVASSFTSIIYKNLKPWFYIFGKQWVGVAFYCSHSKILNFQWGKVGQKRSQAKIF